MLQFPSLPLQQNKKTLSSQLLSPTPKKNAFPVSKSNDHFVKAIKFSGDANTSSVISEQAKENLLRFINTYHSEALLTLFNQLESDDIRKRYADIQPNAWTKENSTGAPRPLCLPVIEAAKSLMAITSLSSENKQQEARRKNLLTHATTIFDTILKYADPTKTDSHLNHSALSFAIQGYLQELMKPTIPGRLSLPENRLKLMQEGSLDLIEKLLDKTSNPDLISSILNKNYDGASYSLISRVLACPEPRLLNILKRYIPLELDAAVKDMTKGDFNFREIVSKGLENPKVPITCKRSPLYDENGVPLDLDNKAFRKNRVFKNNNTPRTYSGTPISLLIAFFENDELLNKGGFPKVQAELMKECLTLLLDLGSPPSKKNKEALERLKNSSDNEEVKSIYNELIKKFSEVEKANADWSPEKALANIIEKKANPDVEKKKKKKLLQKVKGTKAESTLPNLQSYIRGMLVRNRFEELTKIGNTLQASGKLAKIQAVVRGFLERNKYKRHSILSETLKRGEIGRALSELLRKKEAQTELESGFKYNMSPIRLKELSHKTIEPKD